MERTYNVFVDNGLYVLGHYLQKNINDIIIEDLKNSTSLFADKFIEYENCGYYKKNIDMGFHNSAYTQATKKGNTKQQNVLNQYNSILNNIGDDEFCTICGKKHIKLNPDASYLSSLSRCLMPRLHANTFVNYINNLQLVNICPICVYLSMLSLFNFNKAGASIVLYNSDDEEFMEDYTYEMQIKLVQNISMQATENKDKISNTRYIENTIENILNKHKLYNGYIQAISFYNGGQSETYLENIVTKKDLNFIGKINSMSLLSEFKEKWLFSYLVEGKLQKNYLYYVSDGEYKLKVSKELFNEIEKEYCRLSNEKLQLIKDICNKVYKTNAKNEVSQLKGVSNINQFENLLIKWNEEYKAKANQVLFEIEDFDKICNIKEYILVKNRMLVQFTLLN